MFDQDIFASKLRQNCISSNNPWRWYVQLGKDMRMKSREAPSTDLMSGANEEEGWRAVWREERVDMGERPEE